MAPGFQVAGFAASGLARLDRDVMASSLIDEANRRLAELDLDRLLEQTAISSWRAVFKSMGLKAAEFRSSVEQLVRRSLRSGLPVTGIGIVDLYNRASIAHLAPVGGYDLSKISAPISVRGLGAHDVFTPLGGEAERFPIKSSVLGYVADREIICWALNCRDSARTSMSEDTAEGLFLSEAINPESAVDSIRALGDLRAALLEAGAVCGPVLSGPSLV